MGFYSPSQLIQDARRHDIEILPVDVQHSTWDHRLEATGIEQREQQGALQLGLRLIKGLGEEAGLRIQDVRPFRDAEDLARRANLNDQALRFLARAGALESLSGHRYQAHWEVAGIETPIPLMPPRPHKQVAESASSYDCAKSLLPVPSRANNMLDDYRYLGLSLGPHPMALLRNSPDFQRYSTAVDLNLYKQGRFVRVAGLVTGRQRPQTATGVLFVTLEDETGNINLVVWSSVFDRYRAALLQGQLLKVKGVVEREGEVIHVVVGHIDDGSDLLAGISRSRVPESNFKSRDFK